MGDAWWGVCVWQGGVHGGGMCGRWGACMVREGMCGMRGGGTCMAHTPTADTTRCGQ